MSMRWAYEISMRRGYLKQVDLFCIQPSVIDAARQAELWLATQPRDSLIRACLDLGDCNALAAQLGRAGCGDVWFLTSHEPAVVLGPFVTAEAAYDITTWFLRGGGEGQLVEESPLTRRWMLSVLASGAAASGYVDTLELLLATAAIQEGFTAEEYQSLLDHIARTWTTGGNSDFAVEVATVLLAHGCSFASLHDAGDLGSDSVNRFLARQGSYLGALDDSNMWFGSVHHAYLVAMVEVGADPHTFPWHRIVSTGTVDAVRLLVADWYLDMNARLSGPDPARREWTPLMYSVLSNNVSIVTMLLDHGADLTLTDHDGRTALITAIMFSIEVVVELLLSRGADPKLVDKDGRTALDHAMARPIRGPRMVELLRAYGAP